MPIVRASQYADTVVAPKPKYCFEYEPATKKRCPGELLENASAGLFGSPLMALLLNEPDAIDPGSTVFLDSP